MQRQKIAKLFKKLQNNPQIGFPKPRRKLNAPPAHGVYVIRSRRGQVQHVGRTQRGKNGLYQRLRNHLHSQSSYVKVDLKGKGYKLRNGYTFQYVKVSNERNRALLEHFAIAWYCPKHLGTGIKDKQRSKLKK